MVKLEELHENDEVYYVGNCFLWYYVIKITKELYKFNSKCYVDGIVNKERIRLSKNDEKHLFKTKKEAKELLF